MAQFPSVDALVAHTPPPEAPESSWQELLAHLEGTASRAEAYMDPIGCPEWGHLAGLLHDLGKATPAWQAYLRKVNKSPDQSHTKVDHKLSGALFASDLATGTPLSLAIAGHHGGVPDWADLRQTRLADPQIAKLLSQALDSLPGYLPVMALPLPAWILEQRHKDQGRRSLDVFTRMLFSALVDADSLDTEAYYAQAGSPDSLTRWSARGHFPPMDAYLPQLDAHLRRFKAESPVQNLRAEVLAACRTAGPGQRGAWTLTVPTGGGKTLSSLAWALDHAKTHGLGQVIVALPFTTIIDQTAKAFREAFADLGPSVILEHHSNLDPRKETMQDRVAADNWDAPLIVTTQIQLFESLFSNKPSSCRKVHRLQNSVIILDEVQSLPRHLLAPILDLLNELVAHYGVSLLLMTATQPSLGARNTVSGRFPGLDPAPREIIPANLEARLWEGLRRVQTHWPSQWQQPDSQQGGYWEALANRVLEHPRVLAICHLKRDAQALFRAIAREDPDALHLSAAMCPAHRRAVLRSVRQRLGVGLPCRLVTTQVVEAGVDIDFPVVFRAMAGLESLAQSAGRCNREGRLDRLGQFFVFDPPSDPPGELKEHRAIARTLLADNPELDLFAPATFQAYFAWLHDPLRLDGPGIQPMREAMRFRSVSEAFQMIPEATTPIFLPICARAKVLLERLRKDGPDRGLMRALQPYAVSVYDGTLKALLAQRAVEDIRDSFHALYQAPGPHYDRATGFQDIADATAMLIP